MFFLCHGRDQWGQLPLYVPGFGKRKHDAWKLSLPGRADAWGKAGFQGNRQEHGGHKEREGEKNGLWKKYMVTD